MENNNNDSRERKKELNKTIIAVQKIAKKHSTQNGVFSVITRFIILPVCIRAKDFVGFATS